jgi:hypothetical protein
MSSKSRRWMFTLFCTAITVGIVVRIFLFGGKAAVHAGNETRFIVHPAGVYFSPDGGDVIKWSSPTPGTTVYVHFVGSSPCNEGLDTSICTIKKRVGGTFKYYCTDQKDRSAPSAKTLCEDPGIDPNSDTGLARIALADSAPSVQGTSTLVNAGAKTLVVACNNTNLVVYYGTGPVKPPNYPVVSENDSIEWDSDADIGATIAFDKPGDCPGDLSSNPATCTVAKATSGSTLNYTVTGTCKKQPATPVKSAFTYK